MNEQNRDYFFAARSNDEEAINVLKEISVKAYNNEDYKLTPKILQVNEEGDIREFK